MTELDDKWLDFYRAEDERFWRKGLIKAGITQRTIEQAYISRNELEVTGE